MSARGEEGAERPERGSVEVDVGAVAGMQNSDEDFGDDEVERIEPEEPVYGSEEVK